MGIASKVSVFRDGRKCWAVDKGGSSVPLPAPDALSSRRLLPCSEIVDGNVL